MEEVPHTSHQTVYPFAVVVNTIALLLHKLAARSAFVVAFYIRQTSAPNRMYVCMYGYMEVPPRMRCASL